MKPIVCFPLLTPPRPSLAPPGERGEPHLAAYSKQRSASRLASWARVATRGAVVPTRVLQLYALATATTRFSGASV